MFSKPVVFGSGAFAKVIAALLGNIVESIDCTAKQTIIPKNIDGRTAYIAIEDNGLREHVFCRLVEARAKLPPFVAPLAFVSPYAKVGEATVILPGAVVMPGAIIGRCCIVGMQASIDHEALVDDQTFIGTGVIIPRRIKIGSRCIVRAASFVTRDVHPGSEFGASPSALSA